MTLLARKPYTTLLEITQSLEVSAATAKRLIADQFADLQAVETPEGTEYKIVASLKPEAARRVRAQGYEIGNVDSTIIAQAPRMASHIVPMRERIAALLGIAVDQVNVKAKTAEKMGPVGEGLAIEAKAIVLLF